MFFVNVVVGPVVVTTGAVTVDVLVLVIVDAGRVVVNETVLDTVVVPWGSIEVIVSVITIP
jgi:hypothetical protein